MAESREEDANGGESERPEDNGMGNLPNEGNRMIGQSAHQSDRQVHSCHPPCACDLHTFSLIPIVIIIRHYPLLPFVILLLSKRFNRTMGDHNMNKCQMPPGQRKENAVECERRMCDWLGSASEQRFSCIVLSNGYRRSPRALCFRPWKPIADCVVIVEWRWPPASRRVIAPH